MEAHADRASSWLKGVIARRIKNVAAVALANKNVRIAWAVLGNQRDYEPTMQRVPE